MHKVFTALQKTPPIDIQNVLTCLSETVNNSMLLDFSCPFHFGCLATQMRENMV